MGGAIESKLDASAPVRGCVLAGGAASRFGGAKASAPLAGRPLIAYPLAALDKAGLDPVIVAKPDTALPDVDAEVWLEPPEPRHPLRGIVEALGRAEVAAIVACPCDLPFLTADLVRWLADLPDPLAVAAPQPLLGRYSVGLARPLTEAIGAGRSVRATAAALGARLVGDEELRRFGDPEQLLANVNDAADLAAAERRLGRS